MTQSQKVKQLLLQFGSVPIKDIAAKIEAPEPSVRRVLGQGEKRGVFKRLERGIYTLSTSNGEERAYVAMDKAEEALPRMIKEGRRFDMVLLDIPYYSEAMIGRNRSNQGKGYDFMHPQQFSIVVENLRHLMRTNDSHVYLMLSGAPSAQIDMQKYIFEMHSAGFKQVDKGHYKKLFKDGKPVTNVRGKEASAEHLFLFTLSGDARTGEIPIIMEHTAVRPSIRSSYPTQKADSFLQQLIKQSTYAGDIVADICLGSGRIMSLALTMLRQFVGIEPSDNAINNYIIPELLKFT